MFSVSFFFKGYGLVTYPRQSTFLIEGPLRTAVCVWFGSLFVATGLVMVLPENVHRFSAVQGQMGRFNRLGGYLVAGFNRITRSYGSMCRSNVCVCYLRIVGLGYKLLPNSCAVEMKVGFSVNNHFLVPKLVRELHVLDKRSQTLCVVGEFSSETSVWVRSMQLDRGYDPYKGKGLHYIDTYPGWCYPYFKLKVGKKSEW